VEGDQFTVVTDSRRLAKYWPLVEQLGHASAIVRQDATRQLIEAGKDALTIVRLAESCADPQASRAGAQYIETCIQVNCLLADLASRNGETRRRALLQLEVLANSAQRDVVQDLLRGELEEMSPHMRPVIAGILKNNP
jgi:hypothetical protein